MAVDSNAITLSEYAIQSNDPLVTKITYALHKTVNILKDIPIVTDNTMKMVGVRFNPASTTGALPSVHWGQINKVPTYTKGKPEAYEEQVYLIRDAFQIDKRLVNEKNQIESPVKTAVDSYMEELAYETNYRLINNDPADVTNGNPDAFAGFRTRLDRYDVYGTLQEMKIDAGGVDMSTSGLNAANANLFTEYIEQMFDFMGASSGEGCVLYMNDFMKRRWNRGLRLMSGGGGGYNIVKDAFEREVDMYRSAKVRDVGRKDDQLTRIIQGGYENGTWKGETAAGADGATNTPIYTSVYAVHYGDGFFKGWQTEPLKPNNLGLSTENGIMYNIVVDWGMGLWIPSTRALCRLYDIKIN